MRAYLDVLVGKAALFLESLATPQGDSWDVECGEVRPLGRPHEEKLTPECAQVQHDEPRGRRAAIRRSRGESKKAATGSLHGRLK